MNWNKVCGYATCVGFIGAGITGAIGIYTDGFTNDKVEDVKKAIKSLSYFIGKNIFMPVAKNFLESKIDNA